MNILVITNVYLRKGLNPNQASFVRDQLSVLHRYHPDIEFTSYIIHGQDNKLSYLRSIFEARKLVNSGKFDLVHIHYGLSGLFLLFMKNPQIPVIATLHGGDIQIESGHPVQVLLTKRILKKCNFVLSLNERMRGIVSKYCNSTEIIPISVDMNYFTPSDSSSINTFKSVKIIFPASLNRPEKNHPLFEQTVNILEHKYGYKVQEIDFDNISHEEVLFYYKTCDLVLLTSVSEGSPGVIKESMACNLPIVSTNVGDVAHNLQGVANCAVSPKMEAENLAKLCIKCLRHEISGITGRERLQQLGYDDRSIADKIYALYSKMIAKNKKNCKRNF